MMLNNIAVLIDADNASAKTIGVILQAIEKLGKIRTKKIYGDWGQSNLSSWQEVILKYAIDPMQQFSYVMSKAKNATDIALVIEAMDLFELVKVASGWQFNQRQQLVKGDLRRLCEVLGVEVSDD